jgi:hypothetical protein
MASFSNGVRKNTNMAPKYMIPTVSGWVKRAKGRDRSTASHRVLVARLAVCSSKVDGAPMASSGGATTMSSRCCTMWDWK